MEKSNNIGTLNERTLHGQLKEYIELPGDLIETKVDNFVIDILRDNLIIEIQTGNFSSLRNKFMSLSSDYTFEIVWPLVLEKYIFKQDINSAIISSRRSPKKGRCQDIFTELVYIADLIGPCNVSITLVQLNLDEFWVNDQKGSWRRKYWSKVDQKASQIFDVKTFKNAQGFLELLPPSLPGLFSTRDLVRLLGIKMRLAQKMCYSLVKMGLIEAIEIQGNLKIYKLIDADELHDHG